MAAIRIGYVNRWETGTVTATSSAAGYSPVNTQNTERSLPWRSSTSSATQNLIMDLGAAVACTMVALANYNIRSGGTLKLYEGGSGGAPGAYNLVATLTAQDALSAIGYAFFGSTSARHWKLEWTTAGTDYAECGYVFLGAYFEAAANPMRPAVDLMDPSVMVASLDGQKTFSLRPQYSQGSFSFPIIEESQLTTWHAIFQAVGQNKPFFVVIDASTSWMGWLLRMASPLSKEVNPTVGRTYRLSWAWEEAL